MVGTRLSVPVSREMADAARRLRAWVNTPGFSDLCAGASPIDVGTLERLHTAVDSLHVHTVAAMDVAGLSKVTP